MNVLTTTWHQLVRRRLWPVALLLVAALVAVPFVLAKQPEPIVAEPPVGNAVKSEAPGAEDAFAEPVVAKAAAEDRSRRRRVLGSRKDPFKPAPLPKPKKTKKPAKTDSKPEKKDTTSSKETGGSSAPTVPTTPSLPTVPAVPTPQPKVFEKGSLIVRFGDATGTLERMNLKKLSALPKGDDADQLLVYTGLTDHGKKAVFLVDASLTPTGDGTCKPHPASCETIELSKGETEFFDVVDPETGEVTAQFELDLVEIK